MNDWISAPDGTSSLSLAFQPTKSCPVSDNQVAASKVSVLGESQYCSLSDNIVPSNPPRQSQQFPVLHHASTVRQLIYSPVSNNTSASLPSPKDDSLNKQTTQTVFLELPVHKYPISKPPRIESQCKKTRRYTSLLSRKIAILNKKDSQTLQHSDEFEIKLSVRTYLPSKNKIGKSQHEEKPSKPDSFCPHNDVSKLTTAKLTSFHELNKIHKGTGILNEHNGKNCGKVDGSENACKASDNIKLQDTLTSVVFGGEIKQTVETKEREIIEDEFKHNKSVRPSYIRQFRAGVCKSVNEVGDGIYDCEETENKQCQSNSVRFFQITKTKRNGQCSVFACVENNCKPSKDSLNRDSRNGKSKKHREEEKFIDGKNLENRSKKKSSIRSEVNEISEVTATDGIDVHGDEKCDEIVVAYNKTRPIKMESNIVITIDDSDDEDLGNRSKLFTETGAVIAKAKTRVRDEYDGYGGVRRYEARSIEMESKTVITIDENDDDSKSEDDIDIIILDEHNEKELGSRARATIAINTEEDGLNISDAKLKVIKSEEKPEVKKEGNNRMSVLTETSYHMTDCKEHDMTIIKEPMEGIKVEQKYSLEWPHNSDNLTEEVSYPLCPFQYPDLSKDVKAGEYYQAEGSTEVIEDSLDSRLIIDEIKEENQTDLSFEPRYDSSSDSCKTPTPDLEHTTEVLGNKTEFSTFNTETEMMTGEEESLEYYKCLSAKEEINRVRCFTCKKSFPSQRVLAKHILNHTGGKVFRCEECRMQFMLMSQLTAHKDKKHLKTFYSCKHCGVSFNTR